MLTEPLFGQLHCRVSVNRERYLQQCAVFLCTHSRFQALQQVRLLCLPAFLHQHVEGVEEGIQRGVEGHHEDGHSDVELPRDGSSCGGQHTQQADREPTQEVRQNNGGQAARDGGVSGPRFRSRGYGVGAHRTVDERLAHSDQQEQHEVENDHHAEGVVVTMETLTGGERQWDTDTSLTVELPV